jgi:hypothetical protein
MKETEMDNELDLVLCDNKKCFNAIINDGVPSADGLGVFCSEECKNEHEWAEFWEWLFAAVDQPMPA